MQIFTPLLGFTLNQAKQQVLSKPILKQYNNKTSSMDLPKLNALITNKINNLLSQITANTNNINTQFNQPFHADETSTSFTNRNPLLSNYNKLNSNFKFNSPTHYNQPLNSALPKTNLAVSSTLKSMSVDDSILTGFISSLKTYLNPINPNNFNRVYKNITTLTKNYVPNCSNQQKVKTSTHIVNSSKYYATLDYSLNTNITNGLNDIKNLLQFQENLTIVFNKLIPILNKLTTAITSSNVSSNLNFWQHNFKHLTTLLETNLTANQTQLSSYNQTLTKITNQQKQILTGLNKNSSNNSTWFNY